MSTRAKPTTSVVMPVYDAAATLAAALASLRLQSSPDWELVAIDDGSHDGSRALLGDWAGRDPRIRVVAGPHRGIVAALNLGLGLATGRFIARMDADDVALPARLERQQHHLERHPEVGLVATRVVFGGDRTRQAGYARYVDWTNTLLTHDEIFVSRFVDSPLAHPSVMFRREVVDRGGGYAEGDFPEDYELWLRWLEAGVRMDKLAEPLVIWTDRATRLSRRDPRYAPEAFARLKARYLARWLAGANPHHPAIVLWGAGQVTRRRAQPLLDAGVGVSAYIDIDPRKIGRTIGGRPVLAPADLPPAGACFVVSYVGVAGARALIEGHLQARGYRPGVDYVLAA